jgi:GTPase involved in cell partitioning and DNA repair
LELFSPKLVEKQQVVVLNKIDMPHVAEKQAQLEKELLAVLGHKRFMSISAAKRINTSELVSELQPMQ